jgi:hypothetical protein
MHVTVNGMPEDLEKAPKQPSENEGCRRKFAGISQIDNAYKRGFYVNHF